MQCTHDDCSYPAIAQVTVSHGLGAHVDHHHLCILHYMQYQEQQMARYDYVWPELPDIKTHHEEKSA